MMGVRLIFCCAVLLGGVSAGSTLFAQDRGGVAGIVVDDSTGAPLAGANILLDGTRYGTAAASDGRFRLTALPAGSYMLVCGHIGYAADSLEIMVPAHQVVQVQVRLSRRILAMAELEISAPREQYEQRSLEIQPSVARLAPRDILLTPTFGDPDLFRALQLLPGITSSNQASNQLHIRGGSPDQNLVRLDGARIFNPFHLFGLAANINPDIVENVTVSTGGYAARYGDALSGVIDVESRTAEKGFDARGSISLVSSSLTGSGRIGGQWNWLLSARRTYHDWAARLFGKELPYHFFDLFAVLQWQPGERHSLKSTIFYSGDAVLFEETERELLFTCNDPVFGFSEPVGTAVRKHVFQFPWDNLAVNGRWEFRSSPQLQTRLDFGYSKTSNSGEDRETFAVELAPGFTQADVEHCTDSFDDVEWRVRNRLDAWQAAYSAFWKPTPALDLHTGLEYTRLKFDYFWFGLEDFEHIVVYFDEAPAAFDYQRRYSRWSLFSDAIWQVRQDFQVQMGLRFDYRSPPETLTIDPRVSASFTLSPAITLKAALGRYTQGIAFLREQGLFGVNELFFPLNFSIAANHAIAGIVWQPGMEVRLQAEAYLKSFARQPIAISGRPDIATASANARGVEISLRRKNFGLIYVFSRASRNFAGIEYNPPWDIRHRLEVVDQIALGKGWTLGYRWALHSGQPYAPLTLLASVPILRYDPETGRPWIERGLQNLPYAPGAIRYPTYHRLDLTLSKKLDGKGWSVAPFFHILNVYNRANPLLFEWEFDLSPTDFTGMVQPRIKTTSVPLLPSLGVRFSF